MPTRKDKDGYWHAEACVNGRRLHRRLPSGATASEAKRVEAELVRALGRVRQRQVAIPGDPRLTDLMAAYFEHCKTLRHSISSKEHATAIGPWLEGRRAAEARQVAAQIIKDMSPHYAPATINRRLGTLRKALRLAFDAGRTDTDYSTHIRRLPENNQRTVYLTIAEVKQIADQASDNVRAAIWIALLTGCRRGEVCKIKAEDITESVIRLPADITKTESYREVPITEALRPWLAFLPMAIKPSSIKSGFAKARKAAGFDNVRFHDLRHACATILLSQGVPLHVVRDVLGHASIRTTERYAHTMVEAQRDALDKLSDLHREITPAPSSEPQ
jgi:integrase